MEVESFALLAQSATSSLKTVRFLGHVDPVAAPDTVNNSRQYSLKRVKMKERDRTEIRDNTTQQTHKGQLKSSESSAVAHLYGLLGSVLVMWILLLPLTPSTTAVSIP
jgi:hypothetical protein